MTFKDSNYDVTLKSDLESLALKFVSELSSKEIILLQGPLGIGKSEWVRLCLKNLGYKDSVSSPSFSLHQFYEINGKSVDHIDLYRIVSDEELESIGFFDLFVKKSGLIFIEWAERLRYELLPHDWNKIYLNFRWDGSKRKLAVNKMQSK